MRNKFKGVFIGFACFQAAVALRFYPISLPARLTTNNDPD